MEIQLQELIDSIKTEGLDSANAEAARIVAAAESRARDILAKAEAEAAAAKAAAVAEAARQEAAGKAALAQASRDYLLAFKASLEAMLVEATKVEVEKAYGPEVLPEAVAAAVKGLAEGKPQDLAVLLPAKLLAGVDAKAASLLAKELAAGLSLKAGEGLVAGFKVVEKGGAAYYDFSADSLAELFAARLGGRLGQALAAARAGL